MICLHQVKHRIDDVLDRRSFIASSQRRVGGIILVHRCIDFAGGYGIKANAVFCILDCQILVAEFKPPFVIMWKSSHLLPQLADRQGPQ